MINLGDLCCGVTFPFIGIVLTVFLLYLRKKGFNLSLRRFRNDNDAVMVISRAFAITIPFVIVTILQTTNAIGIDVWDPLVSISVSIALILSGAVIAVLGLKTGFYYPIILVFVIWIICIFMYLQFEANII